MFTMGEGETPLVEVKALAQQIGCAELYFKLEGCNPSGSFKDRGMVMAIAKAMEMGSKAVMCASTGNTSASAAAYAAYNGLLPIIIIPKGKIALGKLAQAIIFALGVIVFFFFGVRGHALSLRFGSRQIDRHTELPPSN